MAHPNAMVVQLDMTSVNTAKQLPVLYSLTEQWRVSAFTCLNDLHSQTSEPNKRPNTMLVFARLSLASQQESSAIGE